MYIPLGHLYSWIAQIAPDIMLYYFYPNGSRNIEHLENQYRGHLGFRHVSWQQKRQRIFAVANDQEPLNHDLYAMTSEQLGAMLKPYHDAIDDPYRDFYEYKTPEFLSFMTQFNVAALIKSLNRSIVDGYILLHSELRSPEVDWYENNHARCVYYWCHGIIARDWYRYAALDPQLKYTQQFEFDFNIYCRAWTGTRRYRLAFLQSLLQNGLQQHCRISFSNQDQGMMLSSVDIDSASWGKPDLGRLSQLDSEYLPAQSSATYDPEHYQLCAIDVVLETLFDDTRWHLTEKTLRPIACGKPFILAATPGSLRYLQQYGFRTFGDLWDESYDMIDQPQQRLHAIIELLQWISRLTPALKQKLYQSAHEIAQHNFDRFHSAQFQTDLQEELRSNLLVARDRMISHHTTGYEYLKIRQMWNTTQKEWWINGAGVDRQQQAQLILQCLKNRQTGTSPAVDHA